VTGVDSVRCRRGLSMSAWRVTTASLTNVTGTVASSVAFRNVSLSAWSAKVSLHHASIKYNVKR